MKKHRIRYGRKRSSIRRELKRKIDKWLESISDEPVQEQARQNTIVTGGAIASMLVGEKVNDFDIYFRDKATALAVAQYYASSISKNFGARVEEQELENVRGVMEDRVVVKIPSQGILFPKEIAKKKSRHHVLFMSNNAITLTGKIQLIIRFYGEPDQIHNNYDFTHAKCYWDHGNESLVLPADAMECLLSRTLIYTGSLYPIASIFRMKKFINRGWRISAGQQLKIMWQISEIDLSDKEVLREQLTGVDELYMAELIDALNAVPAAKITSTYVGKIIDRIFS